MTEKLEVRLEEEPAKKPGFLARNKNKLVAAGVAVGAFIATMIVLVMLGPDGKATLDAAQEDWEARKRFEESVDGSFDGSDL